MPWTPGLGIHSNLQVWLFRAAQPPSTLYRRPHPQGSPSAQDHPQKPGTRQGCPPQRPTAAPLPSAPADCQGSGHCDCCVCCPGPGGAAPDCRCPHLPAPQGSGGRARRPGSPLTSAALSPHQRHCSVGTVPRSQFSAETKRWGRERGAAGEGEGE